MTHSFGFCAALRTFTSRNALSRSVGASKDCARKPYSREMDMQARLKTSRTASAGVGTVGFMEEVFRVVHGSHFWPGEPLNATQLI